MLFAHLCGCNDFLEQPSGSVMPKLQPLKGVLQCIKAKKRTIWHGAYDGTNPKPLQIWSPNDLSALVRPRPKHLVSKLIRYGTKRTASGEKKKTYSGEKTHLKRSQTYCKAFGEQVASLVKALLQQS